MALRCPGSSMRTAIVRSILEIDFFKFRRFQMDGFVVEMQEEIERLCILVRRRLLGI